MRFTIRHVLDADASTFWNRVFFDPEYNEVLCTQHLGFEHYRLLALEHLPDGSIRRRVECAMAADLPAVVRRIAGGAAGYVEEGRFDPKTQCFDFKVIPHVGASKVDVSATVRADPAGERSIARVMDVEARVSVPGVGRVVEGILEKQMRTSYDAVAEFTNRWIADRGLARGQSRR